MIVEFQHEDGATWLPLGIARTASERLDVEAAVVALKTARGTPLTEGTYRLRALEPAPRWRYAEIDAFGSIRLVDRAESD